jgi:surface antigen
MRPRLAYGLASASLESDRQIGEHGAALPFLLWGLHYGSFSLRTEHSLWFGRILPAEWAANISSGGTMTFKSAVLAATAILAIGTAPALAQERPDPDGYYSDTDHEGFYDRDGHYRHFRDFGPPPGRDYDDEDDAGPPPVAYREGDYERDCHRGNAAAGTIFGAIGGGLIGGAASHGNAGAVVGGVLLGGLLGNALSRDVDCDDQRVAFNVYAEGLNGDVGRRYEWHRGPDYGYFTPTREYWDGGLRCREFTTVTYSRGHEYTRSGVACRRHDGYWHFND